MNKEFETISSKFYFLLDDKDISYIFFKSLDINKLLDCDCYYSINSNRVVYDNFNLESIVDLKTIKELRFASDYEVKILTDRILADYGFQYYPHDNKFHSILNEYEFYVSDNKIIFQYNFTNYDNHYTYFSYDITEITDLPIDRSFIHTNLKVRKATEKEKSLLIDIVCKKYNLSWNMRTSAFENILMVPEEIVTYSNKYMPSLITIFSNDNRDYSCSSSYEKIKCKLTYCDYIDIKVGDIFCLVENIDEINNREKYVIKLDTYIKSLCGYVIKDELNTQLIVLKVSKI